MQYCIKQSFLDFYEQNINCLNVSYSIRKIDKIYLRFLIYDAYFITLFIVRYKTKKRSILYFVILLKKNKIICANLNANVTS